MPKTHYKVDMGAVRRETEEDRDAQMDQSRHDGFYYKSEYELVDLNDIKPEKVWHQGRLRSILEGIDQGRELPPIQLSKKGSRYAISDGIHRYNLCGCRVIEFVRHEGVNG